MLEKKIAAVACSTVAIVALAGCSGGGGGADPQVDQTVTINGGGVKGPLAFANVKAYAFNPSDSAANYRGSEIAAGTTDEKAAIVGLTLDVTATPLPYILEMTTVEGTIDLTTVAAPVIRTLRTVITQRLLDGDEQIYATPLTTMAVDLALNKMKAIGSTPDEAAFEAALQDAASQVISTVGFGLTDEVDIFDTPPLIDSTTDTDEEQANTAAYRTAVEALTAVVYQMEQQSSGEGDTNTVLTDLADDLADGVIDGTIDGSASTRHHNQGLRG